MLPRRSNAPLQPDVRRPHPTPDQLLARVAYYNDSYGNKPQPRVIVLTDDAESGALSG